MRAPRYYILLLIALLLGLSSFANAQFQNGDAGKNLARWYGNGTSARGRIGNKSSVTAFQNLSGAWQAIDVKINPATNIFEFFFNGTSIRALSYASECAGDKVGQLQFEWINNNSATGNNLFFGDIRVGGS